MVGCGFVVGGVGGDIEWAVASGGHEGWVGCFCLEKRDTQRKREKEMSHKINKRRNYK